MSVSEIILETLLGLFAVYMGYRVGWMGSTAAIHRYHYAFVSEADRPKFCRRLGIAEIVLGAGIAAMPWLNLLTGSDLGYWIGAAAAAVGAAGIVCTIIKYNGRLF